MAKKKKSSKKGKDSKETTVKKAVTNGKGKGRAPRKGGLHDKIDWVDVQFCQKDKTRPEAVQGLLKKYPEMSENYARTIVYSQMNEYTFVAARGKGKAASKKKAATSTKTVSSKSSKKDKSSTKKSSKKAKAAVADDDFDDFDDF